MIIGSTGWDTQISKAFDSVGQLAASARALFSGKTKEVRDAQKALREDNDATIQKIMIEQSKQEQAKVSSYLDFQKIKTILIKYWWVTLIVLFFLFRKPVMRFLNIAYRKIPRRKKRSTMKSVTKIKSRSTPKRSRTKSNSTSPGFKKVSKVRKGFSRKIGRVTYTDPKKWAKRMRSLRKK